MNKTTLNIARFYPSQREFLLDFYPGRRGIKSFSAAETLKPYTYAYDYTKILRGKPSSIIIIITEQWTAVIRGRRIEKQNKNNNIRITTRRNEWRTRKPRRKEFRTAEYITSI